MKVVLLGAVCLESEGRLVGVSGNRARRALAILALNANKTVTAEQIVDALWPDEPPVTCRDQIYNCIAGLRRLLRRPGNGGAVIERSGGGYELRIAPDRVDALAFERSVRRGIEYARSGDAAQAARELGSGLQLWRGDALPGLSEGSLGSAAAHLEWQRGEAWERRFEAEVALRRGALLIKELYAAVERFPAREGLVRQLAAVLLDGGRPAEALEACDQHRRRLRADFGVEPGPAVRTIENTARDRLRRERGGGGCAEALDLLGQVDALAVRIRHHLSQHSCAAATA